LDLPPWFLNLRTNLNIPSPPHLHTLVSRFTAAGLPPAHSTWFCPSPPPLQAWFKTYRAVTMRDSTTATTPPTVGMLPATHLLLAPLVHHYHLTYTPPSPVYGTPPGAAGPHHRPTLGNAIPHGTVWVPPHRFPTTGSPPQYYRFTARRRTAYYCKLPRAHPPAFPVFLPPFLPFHLPPYWDYHHAHTNLPHYYRHHTATPFYTYHRYLPFPSVVLVSLTATTYTRLLVPNTLPAAPLPHPATIPHTTGFWFIPPTTYHSYTGSLTTTYMGSFLLPQHILVGWFFKQVQVLPTCLPYHSPSFPGFPGTCNLQGSPCSDLPHQCWFYTTPGHR